MRRKRPRVNHVPAMLHLGRRHVERVAAYDESHARAMPIQKLTARPHAPQQAIALDEVMPERGEEMHRHQSYKRKSQIFV